MKKEVLRISLFVIIVLLLCFLCGELFRGKESSFDGYYKIADNSVDVLFVGSSHVYSGYIPAVLWDEYGISSYNIYAWSMPARTMYYYILEALRTQSPSVICIDAATVCGNAPPKGDTMNFDANINFKTGFPRFGLLISEIEKGNNGLNFGIGNDITHYHNNWKAKKIITFRGNSKFPFFRNFGALTDSVGAEPFLLNFYKDRLPLEEESLYYLKALEKLAIKHNFSIVFVVTPFDTQKEEQLRLNWLTDYCTGQKIPFIDFTTTENIAHIDYANDMNDFDHMNYHGAEKLTEFMGDYLCNNFDFPEVSDNIDCATINEDASKTLKFLDLTENIYDSKYTADFLNWVRVADNMDIYILTVNPEKDGIINSFLSDIGYTNVDLEQIALLKGFQGQFSVLEKGKNISETVLLSDGEYLNFYGDENYGLLSTSTGHNIDVKNGLLFAFYDYDLNEGTYVVSTDEKEFSFVEFSSHIEGDGR